MTPEELFTACGFGEGSVDSFYEQLRTAILAKKIRESRKDAKIKLEALPCECTSCISAPAGQHPALKI